MVQTGMTTPYTAFAQQNGGPAGDTSAMKPDMKAVDGGPPGGGGGGGSPNATQQALQALHQSAQHANGVVDQQQNATVCNLFYFFVKFIFTIKIFFLVKLIFQTCDSRSDVVNG